MNLNTKLKIGIISGYSSGRNISTPRCDAYFNQQQYANRHSYTYVFDNLPTKHNRYLSKIYKIQKYLPLMNILYGFTMMLLL